MTNDVTPTPRRKSLPAELRPATLPPAAAGRVGALLGLFMQPHQSATAIEQTILRLQSRAVAFRVDEVLPPLDLGRPEPNLAEARRRLKQIPALRDLHAHRSILDEALLAPPADDIVLGSLVAMMVSMKFNAKISNRESYVEGLVFTTWLEQSREGFTPHVVTSAIIEISTTFRFPPEASEFLQIVRDRRTAILNARDRIGRLVDLRIDAADIVRACSPPVPDDESDAPIPF